MVIILTNKNNKIYSGIGDIFIDNEKKMITKSLIKIECEKIDEMQLKNEYLLCSLLFCESMRRAVSIIDNNIEISVVFEYVKGIDLDEYLIKNKSLEIKEKIEILKKILLSLLKIHKLGYIHLNVNPQNIIINEKKEIFFIDMGNTIKSEEKFKNTLKYSLYETMYIAPETTKRIEENIDFSSDIYSCGIIFYEVFYGKKPFNAENTDEIIYKHIAEEIYLGENEKVPLIIRKIIKKMTEKNKKNRYKTIEGVLDDIQKILENMNGKEKNIILGEKDIILESYIPKEIYGREDEYEIIINNFKEKMNGKDIITIISGEPGIGKTALAKKIKQNLPLETFFIEVKYQEYYEGKPYYAIINGFNKFIDIILKLENDKKEYWINKIKYLYKKTNGMLLNFIPMAEIFTKDIAVEKLNGINLNEGYHYFVFKYILSEMFNDKYNAVFFLDDIQWIDNESLNLIKNTFFESEIKNVFLLGTYRKNELNFFEIFLKNMRINFKEKIKEIELKNLDFYNLKQIVESNFKNIKHNQEDINELSNYIFEKTLGNPFFIVRLMQHVYEEHFIKYNIEKEILEINFLKIEKMELSENVIKLLIDKIKKLDKDMKKIIKIGSCFGESFDLESIAKVSQYNKDEIKIILNGLKEKKYIYEKDDIYYFFHDKIREAAHSELENEEINYIYFNIAEKIYKKNLEKNIIETAISYNKISDTIENEDKLKEIAYINYKAGKKTVTFFAYKKALDFFIECIKIIEKIEKKIEIESDFIIEIYSCSMRAAYFSGEIELIEEFAEKALKHSKNIHDKYKIYKIITEAYLTNMRTEDSLLYGFKALKEFGENIEEYYSEEAFLKYNNEINKSLGNRKIKDILNLEYIQDYKIKELLEIMSNVASTGYANEPFIFDFLTVKQVLLSIKYGNASISSFAYAIYGMILIKRFNQYERGFEFGEMALELEKKIGDKFFKTKVIAIVNILLVPWKQNLKKTLMPLKNNAETYLETGDFEYSGHSAFTYSAHLFYSGVNMNELVKKTELYINQLEKTMQKTTETILRALGQMAFNILNNNNVVLEGKIFSESIQKEKIEKSNNKNTVFYFNFFKFLNFYYYEEYKKAFEIAQICKENIEAVSGSMPVTIFKFYYTLLLFDKYVKNKEEIIKNINDYKIWADNCKENFYIKYKLLNIIYNYNEYGFDKIYREYEKLIKDSKENGFLNDIAICYEYGFLFYKNEMRELAKIYLKKAIDIYKILDYKSKYKCLINQYINTFSISLYDKSIFEDKYKSDIYDLKNILKVSKIINSETDIKKLMEKILIIMMENSGAEKCIILTKRKNNWYVEAEGNFKNKKYNVLLRKKIEYYNEEDIPTNILNYVILKKDNLLINNFEKEFNQDRYIRQNNIKSLFCAPIFYRGEINAVIYLENSLSENIFVHENIEFFKMIAGNFGIALENAYSYYEMENLNIRLQEEIEKQKLIEKELIIQKEKAEAANKSKSMFLANMSHEIRNPMTGIIGMAEVLGMTDINEKQKSYLEKIKFSANHLMAIINDILDLAKIESGSDKLYKETIEFKIFINNLMTGLRVLAEQKYIKFKIGIDEDIPEKLIVDKTKFGQIIVNIVGNAVKFTEEGSVQLIFNLINTNEKEIELEIICIDTGIGIPESKLEEVLIPFVQADLTYSKKYQGTGLGLSITKKLLELMGGEIKIKSRKGEGTKVFLKLIVERGE